MTQQLIIGKATKRQYNERQWATITAYILALGDSATIEASLADDDGRPTVGDAASRTLADAFDTMIDSLR